MTVATSPRFTERAPHSALAPWVARYWSFEVGEGGPPLHHVPPDGATSILIRGGPQPSPTVLVSGPWLVPLTVPIAPGQYFFGARLQPGAQRAILGVPPKQLVNQTLPLNRVAAEISPPDLAPRVAECTTLAAAAEVLDLFFLARTAGIPRPDPLVATAVLRLVASGGEASISSIANNLGTSQRTLLRRFSTATGLSPKQYARICRFRATAAQLLTKDARLSELAATGGYADQSHFSREVLSLTGMTPAALAERTGGIRHELMGPP